MERLRSSTAPGTITESGARDFQSETKLRKIPKSTKFSATKSESYASTEDTRQTEMVRARAYFRANPSEAFSRQQLVDVLGLPLNHITRVTFDLLDEGTIEVCGRGVNPASGRSVEVVRLKPRTMTVTEQSLFDRVGGGEA